MTTDLILKNISKHINLNREETLYFTSLITFKEVTKKSFIQKEGHVCKNLSFVHSGALRAYCMDKEFKEATIMFAVADWWVTDMFCFLNEKPAIMYIEAIENSSIIQLSTKV